MAIPTDDIVLAALVFTTVLVVMVYTIIRMRRQRDQLKRDLDGTPDVVSDQAYNKVALATSEAVILERDGVDTREPRGLITEAQKQIDRHNFASALKTAQSAHDRLVQLRRSRGSNLRPPAGSASLSWSQPLVPAHPGSSASPAVLGPDVSDEIGASSEALPSDRPTPNRAESHFQMNCLASELVDLRTHRANDPRIPSGERFLREAQAAYGKQGYTEALRSAIKGRRAIGAQLETLGPTTPGGNTTAILPDGSSGGTASTVACPQCGRPNRAVDQFCRGCGAPLKVATCPRCKQPLESADSFCGSCGAPIGD
jgi:Double zinc ribbon